MEAALRAGTMEARRAMSTRTLAARPSEAGCRGLRDREDPLGVAHLLHDLVHEERRALRRSLGPARGTQTPPLARAIESLG